MGNNVYKSVDFEDLKWTPLIKGFDLASVDGDLNAEGAPFVLRLRGADGAKFPRTGIRRMKHNRTQGHVAGRHGGDLR